MTGVKTPKALVAPPVRTGAERLPDGRFLGWAEWGPADGTPVLFSPGAATSRHLGFGAEAVHDLGVRLISLDRPGLGASTPAPGRTLQDFAEDTRILIERKGLDRPPAMVGNSQGAPFALACAATRTVNALALVSAADEISEPRFSDVLPRGLQQLTNLCVRAPEEAGDFFAGFTPRMMWDMVMGNSPACDLAVYQQEPFAGAYRKALEEGFSQGAADGYARDAVLAMGRWGLDLAAIGIPVDVWYGAEDRSHSPDQGAGLARRIPGAVRHIVPGIGGAVLWTAADQIFRTLLDRSGKPTRQQ
ncbi:alpha/beta hydrolase [Streptomyces albus subsp. albus]|nr:alpha/beta hydrolase [Streptomyces albus subsp. albus]